MDSAGEVFRAGDGLGYEKIPEVEKTVE